MKILKSKRGIPLPSLLFISDRKDISKVPRGTPFIFGDESSEEYVVRMLEYEVLYQNAIKSGMPFNFKKLLNDAGFKDVSTTPTGGCGEFIDYTTTGKMQEISDVSNVSNGEIPSRDISSKEGRKLFNKYVNDASVYLDISVLKALKVFPVWMDSIEEAITTNIHSFATIDSNIYNKKLEGMYGGIKMTPPSRNLIVIDISGSIPRAVSSTCLALAKNLSESFYADILITGSKSTLYEYSEIYKLNIETIYSENGMGNDQKYFKNLLTKTERKYDTAIVFGDNDHPGYSWNTPHDISDEDGKELNKWEINKVISLHTRNSDYFRRRGKYRKGQLAGYARWFSPKKIEHIEDWCKYLTDYEEHDY